MIKYAEQAEGWLAKRDRAIVVFLLGTGARAAELLAVTEADIRWKQAKVLLHGKGSKDRIVPLGPKVAQALKDYLDVRPPHPSPQIWLTQRKTVMNYAILHAMLHHLGEYAGVENVRPHRFRHTAASELYTQTTNILLTKSYLGHSKIQTTERYLRRLKVEYAEASYVTPDAWLA